MLEWLFGSRHPAASGGADTPLTGSDPPTDKQLQYARKLGIVVPKNASKATLTLLIGEAEALDPSLKTKRGDFKDKQRIRNYGQEKIDEEARWQSLADAEKWLLVVFRRGKTKVAEVVRINGAHISPEGKITIETEVLKITKDRDVGLFVDVGRYLEIAVDKIEWHEIVDEVDFDDAKQFQKYYDRVKSRT